MLPLGKKYVVFKDDDAGKDFQGLKRWIEIVIKNDAKGAIGLIGKYMRNQELSKFLNSLNEERIEIFCHGYKHGCLPFLIHRIFGKNIVIHNEFNRNYQSHDQSLKKYRKLESKYLHKKAITFGPPGNQWNDSVIDALLQNDFKIMFSWRKVKSDLLIIHINGSLSQNSLEEFVKTFDKNKDNPIYTLQFHHAKLSDKQFELMTKVIDFLKNNEGRVFITPSELLESNIK